MAAKSHTIFHSFIVNFRGSLFPERYNQSAWKHHRTHGHTCMSTLDPRACHYPSAVSRSLGCRSAWSQSQGQLPLPLLCRLPRRERPLSQPLLRARPFNLSTLHHHSRLQMPPQDRQLRLHSRQTKSPCLGKTTCRGSELHQDLPSNSKPQERSFTMDHPNHHKRNRRR